MTSEIKKRIKCLRLDGKSYTEIANILSMPVTTIKTFCRRNKLLSADIKAAEENLRGLCKQCGKPLDNQPKRKPRQFCSDNCRLKWWNINRDKVNRKNCCKLLCAACGNEFMSYDAGRKYCCHACYISDRFGKERANHESRTA